MKRSAGFGAMVLLFVGFVFSVCFTGCKDVVEPPTRFIAMGWLGQIYHSADGATWTDGGIPDSVQFKSAAYGNGRFVAVGYDSFGGIAYYSDNGFDWTAANSDGEALMGVAYGNNRFVSVGLDGLIRVSMDGIWWSGDVGPGTDHLTGIAYGNGVFITVGYNNDAWYSEDGINWTSAPLPLPADDFTNISFVNSMFIAISGDTNFMSYDGTWWSYPVAQGGNDVAYGNGRYVTVADGGEAFYSDDGMNWIDSSPGAGGLVSVIYDHGLFIAVGRPASIGDILGTIWYSSNGINWTDASPDSHLIEFGEVISVP